MIVHHRIVRIAIACADTSRELVSFDYEMKSSFSLAVEAAVSSALSVPVRFLSKSLASRSTAAAAAYFAANEP